jgi:hypothetical protein
MPLSLIQIFVVVFFVLSLMTLIRQVISQFPDIGQVYKEKNRSIAIMKKFLTRSSAA